MGTYRQPSQILDDRVSHFREGFKETTAAHDARTKLEDQQQVKLKKEQAAAALKKRKQYGDLYKEKVGMDAEIGAFYDGQGAGTVGYDLVYTKDGKSELVKVSDAQIELLKKKYASKKGDYDNDPNTPDNYRTSYELSEKEKELINDQQYSARRLVYDKDKNTYQTVDTELGEFYQGELEAGNTNPFGIGIKGSIENQIRGNYQVMSMYVDDPDDPNYITAQQNIETGIEQYNNFVGVMQQNSTNLEGILDSDGNLNSLDREGAVLMQQTPQFMLNLNASIDYMTGHNKHRFNTVLKDGQMTVGYRNPNISDVNLEIPYNGLIGNVKKKGFGLVKTTSQKPVDLMYDYFKAGVKDFYKAQINKEKNTYYKDGKKISETQVFEIWDEANDKMREFVEDYFRGSDQDGEGKFTKDPNAQNNWQMLGGANKTGHIFWGESNLSEEQVKEQQDYMIEKVINHMQTEYGADMGSNEGNVASTWTQVSQLAPKSSKPPSKTDRKADYYRNKNIEISGFEGQGFKRASGKYTFPEIKQNYARLAKSPTKYAEFLNYLGKQKTDSAKKIDYYSGVELNKLNKAFNDANKDAIEEGEMDAAQTDLDTKRVWGQGPTGDPYVVGENWIQLSKELRKILEITPRVWDELQTDSESIDSTDELTKQASAEDLYNMLTTA